MTRMDGQEAQELLHDKIMATPFVQDYVQYLVSDVCVGIEVLKDSGVREMLELVGPENSLTAKNQNPDSLRAIFGKDNLRNAVHASETTESASRESNIFFDTKKCLNSAILTNCSLLLIKPHIIQNRQLGQIIDLLLSQGGFEISAMQMYHLNKATSCEFFELYKGVMPEFNQMTDYVSTNGPVIALEIR